MSNPRRVLMITAALVLVLSGVLVTAESVYALPEPPDAPPGSGDIPNRFGDEPCATFDVQGWGEKIYALSDFPGCEQYGSQITVMCATPEGWHEKNVYGVHVAKQDDPQGAQLRFYSEQHGTCGIFPTEGLINVPQTAGIISAFTFGLLPVYTQVPAAFNPHVDAAILFYRKDLTEDWFSEDEWRTFVVLANDPDSVNWHGVPGEGMYVIIPEPDADEIDAGGFDVEGDLPEDPTAGIYEVFEDEEREPVYYPLP